MNTSFVALGVAANMVGGLVATVAIVSLSIGAINFLFGNPKLKILKSGHGDGGLALDFRFNAAKEAVKFNQLRVRLFNPFGRPTQLDVIQQFDPHDGSFQRDFNLGNVFKKMMTCDGLENATVQVEMAATKDGVFHQFDYSAKKFFEMVHKATDTIEDAQTSAQVEDRKYVTGLPKNMIADFVPGKGAHLKVATNPAFADVFGQAVPGQASGKAGAAAGDAPAEENYVVSKVWIEPGCIVCNACEDAYPEVFEVTADTCLIRPEATPGSELLKNGLLVQEAAEACPVEVIKYNKA